MYIKYNYLCLRCFCHRLPQVVWPGIPRGSPCQGQVLPPQMGWQKVVKIHENPADFKAIERCSTTFLDLFCWWLLTKYIGLLGVALAYILKVDRKICGFPSAPGSLAKSLVLWLMPTGSNKGYQIIECVNPYQPTSTNQYCATKGLNPTAFRSWNEMRRGRYAAKRLKLWFSPVSAEELILTADVSQSFHEKAGTATWMLPLLFFFGRSHEHLQPTMLVLDFRANMP